MKTVLATISLAFIVGCTPEYNTLPSSQTITYYDSTIVRDANGEVMRDADGNPMINLSNPREMTERGVMLLVQQRAVESCAATKQRELDLLGEAIGGADTAAGQESWAEYLKQRDLIAALKPDFDSTGCTALVAAQAHYWETVQAELRYMAQSERMRYGLINTALKVAGIYLVTDAIGDTLVGLASAGGSTYIGNSMGGSGGRGGGGGTPGSIDGGELAGGPGGGAAGGNSGDIDFGNAVIQLPNRGSQAGEGSAVLVGREGNYQQTDGQSTGQQGQVITDPNSITQPSAGDAGEGDGDGGGLDFNPDQGQSIEGI